MKKRYRMEVVPTRFALRVYDLDDPDPVNYLGIGQLDTNGHKGALHSLHGRGFYDALAQVGIAPFVDKGLHTVQVCMTQEHCRMLVRQLRGKALVNVTRTYFEEEFNRTFVEADITALPSSVVTDLQATEQVFKAP